MKVAVLKGFALAIDECGVKTRDLVAGTVDEVPDDIAPSLVDEGYVSLRAADVVPGIETVVDIPADWHKAHHKTRVALAKKISGGDVASADEADKIIAAEVVRRAGE
jgi:hypothetical protein